MDKEHGKETRSIVSPAQCGCHLPIQVIFESCSLTLRRVISIERGLVVRTGMVDISRSTASDVVIMQNKSRKKRLIEWNKKLNLVMYSSITQVNEKQ